MKGPFLAICVGLVLAVPITANGQEYAEAPMDPFIVWTNAATTYDAGPSQVDPIPEHFFADDAGLPGSGQAGQDAVPEPASLGLLTLGALAVLRRRRA